MDLFIHQFDCRDMSTNMHNKWIQLYRIGHVHLQFLSNFKRNDYLDIFFFYSRWSSRNYCTCGNTLTYPNLTSSTACTSPCLGNTADLCGSSDGQYFSVYSAASNCLKSCCFFSRKKSLGKKAKQFKQRIEASKRL